jgi:hypothetical protein
MILSTGIVVGGKISIQGYYTTQRKMMNGKIHKYLIFDILLIKYALWLSTSIAGNCSYVHLFVYCTFLFNYW